MTEFKVFLNNRNGQGYGIKVEKCGSRKDGIVIVGIDNDSQACSKNLKVGDKIVRINNKSTENSRNKLIAEIHESKFEGGMTLTIKRNLKDIRHQSDNNLSSSVSSLNTSFQPAFRNSKSSNDLNCNYQPLKKILDSNYVYEENINNYIQDESSTTNETSNFFYSSKDKSLISLEDSDSNSGSRKQSTCVSPSPSNVQVTRKKAYKKSVDESENIYQSQQPRINRKNATNFINVNKESVPVVTVKRKTNQFGDSNNAIFRNYSTNRSKQIFSSTVQKSPSIMPGSSSNTSLVTQIDSPLISIQTMSQTYDSEDGNIFGKRKGTQIKETISLSSITILECEMKITSFTDKKIVKPTWKKYWLETDFSGVHFQCSDYSQTQVSSNSTALNTSIADIELIMNVWDVNNTMTKFYLPIYQSRYDEQIIRTTNPDEIKISFPLQKLEFFVKITEENSKTLCQTLKAPLLEVKMPPVKHKKSISSSDNIRPEIRRFKQSPKQVNEKLSLITLLKTPKVEDIPLVIVLCATLIERFGVQEEGIYRRSGNLTGKRTLEDVIANESPDKWCSHDEWTNVHTVSSLFKGFLRKYTLLDKDTAIKLSTIKLDIDESTRADIDRKLQDIMDMIYHLNFNFKSAFSPDENKCRFETFKYIIKHLYRVQRYHEQTKMNAENLATCFVPNLIEDIPVDDDIQYKESRKIVAHENLTKMVAFWITYADTMCELLEEQKEQDLPKKITYFLNQKNLPNYPVQMSINDNNNLNDIDKEKLVRECIEFYTENVVVSNLSGSPKSPENYFSRNKNSRLYQSVKQPRTVKNRRRNNSGSSMDLLKLQEIGKSNETNINNQKEDLKNQTGSPIISKITYQLEFKNNKNPKKTKDVPFGSVPVIRMTTLSLSGTNKDVPLVVTTCVSIIENFGLRVDGIYRISGRNQDINQIDSLVIKNDIDKWTEESNIKIWATMHNTACLMKKMLKRFCLIPKDTWMHMSSQFSEKLEPEDVKKVLKAAAYHLRLEQVKPNMYYSQSKINCEDSSDYKYLENLFRSATLRYVLEHLKHISLHEADNRMSSNALAVCFVPVIMEEDYSSDMYASNTKCIQIVQLLIDHCDWIFKWDFRPSEDIYGQKMSDNLETHLRDYKPIPCQCNKAKDKNYIAEHDEIKELLEKVIKSRYQIDEIEINDLITFLERKTFEKKSYSTKITKSKYP